MKMLAFLKERVSNRKLRLLATGNCRWVSHFLRNKYRYYDFNEVESILDAWAEGALAPRIRDAALDLLQGPDARERSANAPRDLRGALEHGAGLCLAERRAPDPHPDLLPAAQVRRPSPDEMGRPSRPGRGAVAGDHIALGAHTSILRTSSRALRPSRSASSMQKIQR